MMWVEHCGHFIIYDMGWASRSFHRPWRGLNTYGHLIIYDIGEEFFFFPHKTVVDVKVKPSAFLAPRMCAVAAVQKARTVPGSSLS